MALLGGDRGIVVGTKVEEAQSASRCQGGVGTSPTCRRLGGVGEARVVGVGETVRLSRAGLYAVRPVRILLSHILNV